ncbi:hypothetical protein B0J13DRAFT_526380 [Dactylonectria estremocensis]|uniref:Uncharacterized protein n=1 Tax=Dactylonectria estremocensis TaxID=1079267 RepID=A0A9P9ET17_9HYPO|nr:hypothetical protein B0J13DRAFT_526380 [Dactylonectria estremocensis]
MAVNVVNLSAIESLIATLKGQDAIVDITNTSSIIVILRNLIDATIAAGIYRIIPSKFSNNLNNAALRALPPFVTKAETTISNQAFLNWGICYSILNIDLKNKKITRLVDGNYILEWTLLDWNCSFIINFIGPGYKCDELAVGRGSKVKKLGDAHAPFITDSIVPDGNYSYLAVTDQGDYASPQVSCRNRRIPIQDPPFPKHLGAFRTELILWIGYAAVNDTSQPQPQNSSSDGWSDAYTPAIFGCEYYETNYTIQFTYINGIESQAVKRREFLTKVINTTFNPDEIDDDGTLDNTTASPKSNYVFPRDMHRYRLVAAYHPMGTTFRSLLNGTIELYGIRDTKLTTTRLIDDFSYLPVSNLQTEI